MTSRGLSAIERRDWLRLSLSENVGPVTFRSLLARYGTPEAAIAALPELSAKGGLKRPLRIFGEGPAEEILSTAAAFGASYVVPGEPGYPQLLRHTEGAPPFLCVKGNLALADKPAVGIVGSRNASAIGRKFTRQLAAELGEAGLVVSSGLARGIDTSAHEAALATGTAAAVGGGIDVTYPPENAALQAAIGESGLLISEMILGTVPKAEHFPRRNRIISGMSRAVVVVEAALRSGSLITARFAAEQGRDVYAVPGSPLDPRCEGTNKLIRGGATLLTGAKDILDDLQSDFAPQRPMFFEPERPLVDDARVASSERDKVLGLLSHSPVDLDDLVRESGLRPAVITGVLLELELAGRVNRHPQGAVSLG
jgi:DNA processing protein